MSAASRIEAALRAAVSRVETTAPPRLGAALRHAVFPGGARLRPQLCLAVFSACEGEDARLAAAAGGAVELLHCASLVHDDLPCFDDAAIRRGRPSVHAAFGEPLAVLTGDALIVLAFEELARASANAPDRIAPLVSTLAEGVGASRGAIAGQAWESERFAPLERYHAAKTGALFVASVSLGAIAAGADAAPWREVGARLGTAYQFADDMADAFGADGACGKPGGRDAALHRPNAARAHEPHEALARLRELVDHAAAAVPACNGARELRDLVRLQALRLVPAELALTAA